MVKVVSIVETPNPDALKFFVDQRLTASGVKSFDSPAAGKGDTLAEALFGLGSINSVFYMDRFVTVTKPASQPWDGLAEKVRDAIESTAVPAPEAAPPKDQPGSDDEVLQKINQVLDENVRPALAGDGGGLEVLGYSDGVLSVHYQGACGGCPSAASGTLFAIQNLLQRMVDPRIQVVEA